MRSLGNEMFVKGADFIPWLEQANPASDKSGQIVVGFRVEHGAASIDSLPAAIQQCHGKPLSYLREVLEAEGGHEIATFNSAAAALVEAWDAFIDAMFGPLLAKLERAFSALAQRIRNKHDQ